MRKQLLAAVIGLSLVSISAAQDASACYTPVSEKKLFEVNTAGERVIEAQTDDIIRLQMVYGVIPGNFGTEIEAIYDKKTFALISEAEYGSDMAHQPVGAMGKVYYFRVIGAGKSTIELVAKKDGATVEKASQEVESMFRPMYRCI